jgi:hypothetical protein
VKTATSGGDFQQAQQQGKILCTSKAIHKHATGGK